MVSAVFLDRDGTINIERNYVFRPEDFTFEDGAVQAICALNNAGYKVIVVTNQSGIARGYYQEQDVVFLHNWVNEELSKHNAHIDAFYYCPHHPDFGNKTYRQRCKCRKPAIGLIERAVREHNIDVRSSYLIGDRETDILAGIEARLQAILVRTGYGCQARAFLKDYEIIEADNLLEAVYNYILPDSSRISKR